MNEAVFYEGRGFRVSDRLLITPRKTYSIVQIEFVSVERPLLLFVVPPAIALFGFVTTFHRYLYAGEIATLCALGGVAIVAALLFGTLHVHSLALRNNDVTTSIGLISTLRQVRRAVEKAIVFREHRGEPR